MRQSSGLRFIAATALRFRVLVLAAGAAVLVAGLVSAPSTRLDALPEFAPPRVEIQTEALGLSAAEVEQLITVPLEADLLNGVAWLEEIRSESIAGLSSIELIFEPGTDLLEARQVVAERLTQAHALPNVSAPPAMLQPRSSTSRVMVATLSSDQLSLMDMSVLGRWQIKPHLMGVPGVANVAIWGQREEQLQVRVHPRRLRANGVTLTQVVETAGNALWVSPLSFVEASTPGTGGFVDTPNQRLTVQHSSPITTPQSLAAVTVEDTKGRILRLGQVADVKRAHQPLIGDGLVDQSSGLTLVIEKFPDASTPEVTAGIEQAFAQLAPGLEGIEIDTSVYRPATFIDSALDSFAVAGLAALLLLALGLGVYLRGWRSVLVTLLSVCLSVVAALLVLNLLAVTVNLFVAAGLALAVTILVDDMLAITDQISGRLSRAREDRGDGSSPESTWDAVLTATTRVERTRLVAEIVTLVAILPVLFLPGLVGQFTRPLVLSYGLAVLTAAVVGLTVTPALALALRPRTARRGQQRLAGWSARYRAGMERLVPSGAPVYAVAAVSVVAALALVPLNQPQVVPPMQEPVLLVELTATPGTARAEMSRVAARASQELTGLPGVTGVAGHVGRAITSDRVANVDEGELWVAIDPGADFSAASAAVRDVVNGYPGVSGQVGTYTNARVTDEDAVSEDRLVVRVYGQDPQVLAAKADEIAGRLADVDGLGTPRVDAAPLEPVVEVKVDLAAAGRYQIKPGDVRRAAATMLSGVEVGSLFQKQKVFSVVVWGEPELRHSAESVRDLQIDLPTQGRVRLADVADVRVAPSSTVIQRDAVSRRVDVVADVTDGDREGAVRAVDAAVSEVSFPVEHHAEVLGNDTPGYYNDLNTVGLAVVAFVMILLLLQAALGSWRLAVAVVLTLPAALLGGLLAALLVPGTVTVVALMALAPVLGIAVRTALTLAADTKQVAAERGVPGRAAVFAAAEARALPVAATLLIIGLMVLPVAVLGGAPGLEIVRPAAFVILGGLVSTTLYALVLLPAVFAGIWPTSAAPLGSPPTASDGVSQPAPA